MQTKDIELQEPKYELVLTEIKATEKKRPTQRKRR